MKIKCEHCGEIYDGIVTHIEDTSIWVSKCNKCHYTSLVSVQIPDGDIVMAYTDPDDESDEPYKYFTDNFNGEYICNYYAFDTPEELYKKWEELLNKPRGMWYWVLHNGVCICSGAHDPDDLEETIKPYFNSIDMNKPIYEPSDINLMPSYKFNMS